MSSGDAGGADAGGAGDAGASAEAAPGLSLLLT